MKKWLARLLCVLLCCTFLPLSGLSEQVYLIKDSDTRLLTEEELWTWDYESLGYILNEIFARHGFVFEAGGKYEYYFNCMPWYTPNANSNNSKACYPKLNSVEWANEALVKRVRQQMRDLHTTNKGAKSVWTNFSTGFDTLQGFAYIKLKDNQKLPVYSAPSASSYRANNGKAAVSTNGNIYAAGWENGWLLVMYETNQGSVRVGYVSASDIKGKVPTNTLLNFDYRSATVTDSAKLTDDPARCYSPIATLPAGTEVTYLTTYFNRYAWDYVETTVGGQTVRGFIRSGSLNINMTDAVETGDDYNGSEG